MSLGDLVKIYADNCYDGLGIIMEDDEGKAYRVLGADGRLLYYFPGELELMSSYSNDREVISEAR